MSKPMNAKTDRQLVSERFTSMVVSEQDGFRAVGWGSHGSQMRRFEVMSQIAQLRGARILDVGCGLGAFHNWLTDNDFEHDYYGCDITLEMVKRARENTGLSTIYHGDLSMFSECEQFDYVFASGIFCFDVQGCHITMNKTVADMYALARKGVCFNTLSDLADSKEPDEFYANPARCLTDCQKLSRKVVLRHDYHPADFTVYLYR